MYSNMAFLYDQLMDQVDYKGWYLYIEDIFNRFNKRPKRILEMACGTGNLSYYLGKNGYNLTCFDISSEMLSIAYNKLNRFNNVSIIAQDMLDFKIRDDFEAVISICDSINYIIDKDDLLKVFRNVKEHLAEDGIFIFDINSYYKLKYVIGNNTYFEDKDTVYYIWQNYFNTSNNIGEFYLTFFVSDRYNNYRRVEEEHQQKAYRIEEIRQLLLEAGFNRVYEFDAFTFDAPERESERINFVAL